jgi:hypothetical protein
MIYAEMNKTSVDMAPQQGTLTKQVENDAPASDLGMMVAAGMVLPPISESIDSRGLGQRPDKNFRS